MRFSLKKKKNQDQLNLCKAGRGAHMAGGARPLVTEAKGWGSRPGNPRRVCRTPGLVAERRGSKGATGLLEHLPHLVCPGPGQPHASLLSFLLRPGAEWLCSPSPAPLPEEPPLPHPRRSPGQQSARGPMGRERGMSPSPSLSF